ncbi:hypothetical protein CPB83DRAFT_846544 [Crepidotus variabilis]|uniref:Secreted protein n=1 Tax=Crepidotus variabilis TaxID=179855 RepID=A0A9P6EQK5_9AGAR|nr:hypothetical protein CPB83DRAFT_846544 [Crepidotus variabilis]
MGRTKKTKATIVLLSIFRGLAPLLEISLCEREQRPSETQRLCATAREPRIDCTNYIWKARNWYITRSAYFV